MFENMENKQQSSDNNELLSAFIDEELSTKDIGKVVDSLLKDETLKQSYIRQCSIKQQYMNNKITVTGKIDSSHIIFESSHLSNMRDNISNTIDSLEMYHDDFAGLLITTKTNNLSYLSRLYKVANSVLENKVIGGISVAASVMLVTLFTLQHFNPQNSSDMNNMYALNKDQNTTIQKPLNQIDVNEPIPSLISKKSQLPASLVSTNARPVQTNNLNNTLDKTQYKWIIVDPEMSNQLRAYANEHAKYREPYFVPAQYRTIKN